MYNRLGPLMKQALQAWENCDPQTVMDHLRAKDLGPWLLNRTKSAMNLLYSSAENDAQRAFLWSEMKYETLFPNYTKNAPAALRQQVKVLIRSLGGVDTIVDDELSEANLSSAWSPETPDEYGK